MPTLTSYAFKFSLVDINELQDLSHAEKTMASGELACYRASRRFQNTFRYVSRSDGAAEQKFQGGRYANTRFFKNIGNFRQFCQRGGFNFFF
jgi:hypothetical protein